MAIGIRTLENGSLPTIEPYATHGAPAQVFVLQCHACGYEPEDPIHRPHICPKCHSRSWDRFVRPGSLLANADRYSS